MRLKIRQIQLPLPLDGDCINYCFSCLFCFFSPYFWDLVSHADLLKIWSFQYALLTHRLLENVLSGLLPLLVQWLAFDLRPWIAQLSQFALKVGPIRNPWMPFGLGLADFTHILRSTGLEDKRLNCGLRGVRQPTLHESPYQPRWPEREKFQVRYSSSEICWDKSERLTSTTQSLLNRY